ncbi:DEKNAAC102821 [Brettanomyces naardenensis]|uniref:DEKNAAC102821 n=1 Tax=Brettanomyces naardenensis TaxID=13370 RepID=A0A448YLX5_BRENA|nr:DEKNAAC102821 [Brettanomyces naardenensis]
MKLRSGEVKKELELNNTRTLKQRKVEFDHNLVSGLDLVCYLDLIVLYYADNSILMLLLRSFVQFILGHTPSSLNTMNRDFGGGTVGGFRNISIPNRKLLAQKVLGISTFTGVLSILIHIFILSGSDLVDSSTGIIVEDGQYQHGHYMVDFVGERRFTNWFGKCCYLVGIDLVVIGLQVIIFCINYSIKMELSDAIEEVDEEEQDNELRKEYDGYQGDVLVYKFQPLKVLDTVRLYTKDETMDDTSSTNDGENGEPGYGIPDMPGGFGDLRRFNVGSVV